MGWEAETSLPVPGSPMVERKKIELGETGAGAWGIGEAPVPVSPSSLFIAALSFFPPTEILEQATDLITVATLTTVATPPLSANDAVSSHAIMHGMSQSSL